MQPDHIQDDAGGAQRYFGFLIKRDGRRRVQRDAVPNQLGAAFVHAIFPCEVPHLVGCLDLEAAWPGKSLVERDVVQDRSDRDHLGIVLDFLQVPQARGKEP